jgi:glycosyltransferase involved in cell wall biosynthesis
MEISQTTKRPLKIWHLAEVYPPDYHGGAAIYLRDVCRFSAARGHEVRVLCIEAKERPDYTVHTDYDGEVRIDRVNLPYFKNYDPGGWHLGIKKWKQHKEKILQIAESYLEGWAPDIVQFHPPYSLLEECLPLIKERNLPVVGLLHDAWLICPRLRLMQSPTSTSCDGPGPLKCFQCLYSHWDGSHLKAAVKLPWRLVKLGTYPATRLKERGNTRRHVNGLIGYSEFMSAAHRQHINGPVQHIPLGVDLTHLPPERPIRPRSPLRFGFAGGIQAHKGIKDVLDAARALKQRNLVFELHIWGPDDLGVGAKEIESRGIGDCVFYHGMFEPQELWTVYSQMDLLLMATQDNEPFGRVVQEAAAAGVPSIAPAVAGIAEQIHDGHDGLLYEFRSPTDLVRQMERVVEEPEIVSRLVSNLWTVVDTRAAVAEVEAFYFKVLDKAG